MTGVLMMIPAAYVIYEAFNASRERWLRLIDTRLTGLLINTLGLAVSVTALSLLVGLALAWLVHRYRIPGQRILQWLLAAPLAIPPYIMAVSYIIVTGPGGWIRTADGGAIVNVYSFSGALLVLTMSCYSYVFLIAGASIQGLNKNYEEAALALGISRTAVFWRIFLPLLKPALGAGSLLVFIYVIADFGVVAMLRYTTFTSAIYYQTGSYDTSAAAILSTVLIALTFLALRFEGYFRRGRKFHQTGRNYSVLPRIRPGRGQLAYLPLLLAVFSLGVVLPLAVLFYWSWQSFSSGAVLAGFWTYSFNSFKVAAIASAFCMAVSFPIAYFKSRSNSILAAVADKMIHSGYALPGVIVALGLISVFNTHIPAVYGTWHIITIACVLRFLPQALQYTGSSIGQISPRLDEAARNLGAGSAGVLVRIILPLVKPGLLAGGALVFVSSLKELPATLLLRPPGFDTLAVRIWVDTSESVYYLAAPAALLIIAVSVVPLGIMLRKK